MAIDYDKVDLLTQLDSTRRGWQDCEAELAELRAKLAEATERAEKAERERVAEWNLRREAEGQRDTAKAVVEDFRISTKAAEAERDHFSDAGKKVGKLEHCAADIDGECDHAKCPQLRDGEPEKTGRHCPLDTRTRDGFAAEREEEE
jgi:hypothetical protein